MLEEKPKMELGVGPRDGGNERKQRRRMVFALVLLLAAMAVILVKDRELWFGSDDAATAGDDRRRVRPGTNSVKVDMAVGAPANAAASGPAVSASQRVKMSADTAHVLERPVDPSYPMLARQMKVQGSVILQALIGTDGLI